MGEPEHEDPERDEEGEAAVEAALAECEAKAKRDEKAAQAYKAGDYATAVATWQQSLRSVQYIHSKAVYEDGDPKKLEMKQIEVRLRLNLAQGNLKLRQWQQAVD